MSADLLRPFGPTILRTRIPAGVVDGVNAAIDGLLADPAAAARHDWSGRLVGNVRSEVRVPDDVLGSAEIGLGAALLAACREYLDRVDAPNRPSLDGARIVLTESWVVAQYAGDFNPIHVHDGLLSGVLYLRLPPGLADEIAREDHHPSVGHLEFVHGSVLPLSRSQLRVAPAVGDLYVFPHWLHHLAYPFRSEGERRSLSFNAVLARAERLPRP